MSADVLFTLAEAADLAEVKPALLKLWLETERFEPNAREESGSGGIRNDLLL